VLDAFYRRKTQFPRLPLEFSRTLKYFPTTARESKCYRLHRVERDITGNGFGQVKKGGWAFCVALARIMAAWVRSLEPGSGKQSLANTNRTDFPSLPRLPGREKYHPSSWHEEPSLM
jgi:hypothetical protein